MAVVICSGNQFCRYQTQSLVIFILLHHLPEIYSGSSEETIMKAFTFSHLGGFGSSSFCPDTVRSFITGAKVRLSNHLNQTYPIVTAIDLACSDGIRYSARADAVLILQKNVGNWTDMKQCPNGGFVTGITFYMQTVSSPTFLVDEFVNDDYDTNGSGRFFDVFELGRSRYISGVSLNCSFNKDFENDVDGLVEDEDSDVTSPLIPAWRNTVTLGRPSGMGLRLYCSDDRVISGISVEGEALLTYEEGERWIPLDISTRCSLLTNPVKHCYPELDWEIVDNMTCINTHTGQDATISAIHSGLANVTCQVPHSIGLSPNPDIENLNQILRAYQPMDLPGQSTIFVLRAKLFRPLFLKEWQIKYKLSREEYYKAVLETPSDTYLGIKQGLHVINFTNVNYTEPDYCREIRNSTKEPLKYKFHVKQLVGFCSIYKIYFPLFKSQFHVYFDRKIDGIKSRIVFPTVDKNTSISNLIEAKYGVKL